MNTGLMKDQEVDRFKVWPTSEDRETFIDVMTSNSRLELERRHPLTRKKYARYYDPRPQLVEAYLYFYGELKTYFLGDEEVEPIGSEFPLEGRLEESLAALKDALFVVVIDLGEKDDPQIIFETLNARGQPLLPADLLRNYVFLRAGRAKLDTEKLYATYWRDFDGEFWRTSVGRGRSSRPRSDLFMQHFLSSQTDKDISARHLYVEYKYWVEHSATYESVQEELAALAEERQRFRRIIDPAPHDPVMPLAEFLEEYEVSTAYPLVLSLLRSHPTAEEIEYFSTHLESFLLRRAICGLNTRGYNRFFLSLNNFIREADNRWEALVEFLLSQKSDSTRWPTDAEFRAAWLQMPLYGRMAPSRIAFVLKRLNDGVTSGKNEHIAITNDLTIEHVMPRSWQDSWPLPDGSRGLSWEEMGAWDLADPRYVQTESRDRRLNNIGNLTILTQPLNSAASNGSWEMKREEIGKNTLLPINIKLIQELEWNEDQIDRRAEYLYNVALRVWPRPVG
jgi:hypothetical protein